MRQVVHLYLCFKSFLILNFRYKFQRTLIAQLAFCAKFAPHQWQAVLATYVSLFSLYSMAERLEAIFWNLHVIDNQLIGLPFQIHVQLFEFQGHAWFLSPTSLKAYGQCYHGLLWLLVYGLWAHLMIATFSPN